ncbi:hypothetical protein [Parapedobacter sp. 2B3]|uniref:hypothetical protein n=1 Tax=Parapedobacter sp. 2B3 TaxID=3342381 RepID=UPI0035B5CFB7
MRVLNQIRTSLIGTTDIRLEMAEIKYTVEQIAKKQKGHDQNIELIFEYIDRLQDKAKSISQDRRYLRILTSINNTKTIHCI